MSYQLYAREISARAAEWLRAAPREWMPLLSNRDLHFDEGEYLEPSPDAPRPPGARARRIARELAGARDEAQQELRERGLGSGDVGPVLAHDGWHWAFIGVGFPAIAPLVGRADPEWAIRETKPKRSWLTRLFTRPPEDIDELEEMGLAAQPGRALGAAITAARALEEEEVAEWLRTDSMLNRGVPSAEPVDPKLVRRNLMRPSERLVALAEQVRDRDTHYLTWSG